MPVRSDGVLVNQAELANLYGVSTATIRAWKRRGCPVTEPGRSGQAEKYNTAEVAKWREEAARLAAAGDLAKMDMEEARRRKLAAEAAAAELDLEVKRGTVVEIAIVMEEVGRCLDACRARLLGIGAKVAPVLAIETDAAACKSAVDQAVSEALDELAGTQFAGEPGDPQEGTRGGAR